MPEIIITSMNDIATVIGVSRQRIHQLKDSQPRPDVETPDGKVAWKKSTILRWDAKRRVG